MTDSVSLGFLGPSAPSGSHLCAFYRGSSGRDEILMPFLAEGIRAREKCICILGSLMPPEVLSRLRLHIDVGSSIAAGELELATPAEAYLRSGRFSAEDMLDYWHQVVATTLSGGEYSFTRATGEMPSMLDHPAGRAEFFRYEAKLNEFAPSFPQVILCLYDLERFGAEVLMDALAIHPVVVVAGMVHDHPYYIEPGKLAAGRE